MFQLQPRSAPLNFTKTLSPSLSVSPSSLSFHSLSPGGLKPRNLIGYPVALMTMTSRSSAAMRAKNRARIFLLSCGDEDRRGDMRDESPGGQVLEGSGRAPCELRIADPAGKPDAKRLDWRYSAGKGRR